MKIIQQNTPTNFDLAVVEQLRDISIYPVSSTILARVHELLVPGLTVILFSGNWRLDFDAVYLEIDGFKDVAGSKIHKKTYFVNPENTVLIHKVLQDSCAKNVLFLHSASFCNYRSLDKLVADMDNFAIFGAQVILTVPAIRTDFNRLKYSCDDIAQQYSAEYLENSFIIKRNRQLSKQA